MRRLRGRGGVPRRSLRRLHSAGADPTAGTRSATAADPSDGLELVELRYRADRTERQGHRRRHGGVGHARRRLPLRQPRCRLGRPTRDGDGESAGRSRPLPARYRGAGPLRARPRDVPRPLRQPVQRGLRAGSPGRQRRTRDCRRATPSPAGESTTSSTTGAAWPPTTPTRSPASQRCEMRCAPAAVASSTASTRTAPATLARAPDTTGRISRT